MQQRFARGHVAGAEVLASMAKHLDASHASTAQFLADLAEADHRKLYVPAGYPTMRDYCVGKLKLSEDRAAKRIQVARKALEFPRIFEAIESGSLHLTAVVLIAPHLTSENVEELLTAVAHKSSREIVELLAERATSGVASAAPSLALIPGEGSDESHAARHANSTIASEHASPVEEPQATRLPEPRVPLNLMVTLSAREQLCRALDLLGHEIPSRDAGKVFEKAIKLLVQKIEKRKFGVTDRPRAAKPRRLARSERYIPRSVLRAVSERDQEQCTFVSEDGHRCEARSMLEFHHIIEVARGGESTVANLSLRCRAHNQYEAEITYGGQFMQHKREQAQASAAARRREKAEAPVEDEVIPWLRKLGYSIAEAKFAVSENGPMDGMRIETRLKKCLAVLAPPQRKVAPMA